MASTSTSLHVPEEIEVLLAERVREERLRLGWRQQTLAERAGVSLPTVRRYERTGQATVRNLFRLLHALGRLDELATLLAPPAARSLDELERQVEGRRPPRRGRR